MIFFFHKSRILHLLLAIFLFSPTLGKAYSGITITSVGTEELEGPAHYGLVIQTSAIQDPNLSFYEVQIKEDTGNPLFPEYSTYNSGLKPYDGQAINIPYRNDIFSLEAGKTYCVRVRGIYGNTVTGWSESCGVIMTAPDSFGTDADGDGLSDTDEYVYGTDPNNPDSDGDGYSDSIELSDGRDPNLLAYPYLIVRTLTIDFGDGDAYGNHLNQHQYIELENAGDDNAIIEGATVIDGTRVGSANSFKVGQFPAVLTNIPPQSLIRVPVSFIPQTSGSLSATVQINSSNNPTAISPVTLTGNGSEVPVCNVSTTLVDFGTVSAGAEAYSVQEITISNPRALILNSMAGSSATGMTLGFTLSTASTAMAPGTRGFSLASGKSIAIPIFFRHSEPGNYDTTLEVKSSACVTQIVELKGTAQ
jgi:hypothetical protein